MKKYVYIIFFCCLLLGWSNVCLGGDATSSEIFPGYIQEEYAPESFPKYKQAWDSSFGESMREVDLLKDEMLRHFTKSLDRLRGEELSRESLIEIQNVVNSVEYIPEVKDNWQTISQFLDNNGGDCEEFAITKAVIIQHLFPEAKVYFAIVYKKLAMGRGDRHAIAIVKIQDEVFILDNDRGVVKMRESGSYFIPFFLIKIQSGSFFLLYPGGDISPGQQVARVE